MQGNVTTLSPEFYRPNSKARVRICNFVMAQGGIGDYLCCFPALEYIAETQPHVRGRIFTMESADMLELATHIMKRFPQWEVLPRSKQNDKEVASQPYYQPTLRPINATGCHLIDLGFIYYAHMNPPPAEFNRYPKLDLSALDALDCGARYAVMTPGATATNRIMKAEAFNGIKQHLIDRGILPVFLGKKQITEVRSIDYEAGYDFEGGLDLREKTTLLQAAGIMSKAEVVVGLDNGLLHLAACTDVPILFGYNIASPEHRRPRRISGKIWEIFPDQEELPCTFCQSRMRFLFDHDFAKCVYRDNKCLDVLNDPKAWCDIIDEIFAKEAVPVNPLNPLPEKGA